MKNIHVLPTNKPSRLYKEEGIYKLDNLVYGAGNQNIYITSDEEIKEGDYFYQDFDCIIHKCYKLSNNYVIAEKPSDYPKKICKKIILTTDQDLIKDGVQAIDDEFLEWFVKNPSCESVEVEDVYKTFLEGDKRSVSNFRNKYKIIIPKGEPKQCDICKMYPRLEGTNKCESCYSVVRYFLEQDLEFKDNLLPDLRKRQETLEEAAENHQKNTTGIALPKHTFIAGAMYSEPQRLEALERLKYWEDECQRRSDLLFESSKNIAILTKIIEWYDEESDVRPDYRSLYLEEGELTMWEWFEQFKKK